MNSPVFRVDKFVVPAAIKDEFLARISDTHTILQNCDGFVRDQILEQYGGTGKFNIVTIVEWADQAAIDAAVVAVNAARKETGFDPQAYMSESGIEADLALYKPT